MLYTTPNNDASSIMGTSPDEIDTPKHGSDRVLLVAVIVLMVFGTLAVFSAIAFFAESNNTTAFNMIIGHVLKLSLAFIVLLIVSKMDYHFISKFSKPVLGVCWVLLIIVMFAGTKTFGAQRSLSIGSFSFQPSTIAGVVLLLNTAAMLAEKQDYIRDFKRAFTPILFYVFVTCALIAVENFSSAAVLFSMCMLLMFIGRIRVVHLLILVLIGLAGGSAVILSSPERIRRVKQYVSQVTNIEAKEFKLGSGYQAQQAYIAIARGKIFGVGIGKSTQRAFLPAPYNDYIFAIIAEEYGLVGSIFIMFIFTVILFRGIAKIAKNAPDPKGALLATGATLYIVLYGFINAMVASGLLPVTGLPMPFVSYGGTSMVMCGFMMGLLLNVSKRMNNKRAVFYA